MLLERNKKQNKTNKQTNKQKQQQQQKKTENLFLIILSALCSTVSPRNKQMLAIGMKINKTLQPSLKVQQIVTDILRFLFGEGFFAPVGVITRIWTCSST